MREPLEAGARILKGQADGGQLADGRRHGTGQVPRTEPYGPDVPVQSTVGVVKLVPWLLITIVLLYIAPPLKYVPGTGHRRPEELLIFVLLGLVAVRYSMGRPTRVMWGILQAGLIGFTVAVVISILVGALLGYPASSKDFFEVFRVVKGVAVYTLAVSAVRLSADPDKVRRRILLAIEVGSVVLFPVIIQQYYDLFGLNARYIPLVAKPNQASDLLGHAYATRVLGMIGNPNELGFLYTIAALSTIYLIVAGQRARLVHIVVLGVQLTCILMSLSRSSLIALAVAALYLFVMLPMPATTLNGAESRRRTRRVIGILLLGTVAAFVLLHDRAIYNAVLWRFALIGNAARDSSWAGRLAHWHENTALFVHSPWLGVGPLNKAPLQFAADNEWLLLLRSYGIFGTLFFVAAVAGPHLLHRPKSVGPAVRSHRKLADAVLIATAVYMIPAAVFQSMTLMPLVMIILGSADASSRAFVLRRGRSVWLRASRGRRPTSGEGRSRVAERLGDAWPGSD